MIFPLHGLENKVKGEKCPLQHLSSAPRNQRLRHQQLASWHYQLSEGIMHRLHTQSLSAGLLDCPGAQLHPNITHCFLDDMPVPKGKEYPHPILPVQVFQSWCLRQTLCVGDARPGGSWEAA